MNFNVNIWRKRNQNFSFENNFIDNANGTINVIKMHNDTENISKSECENYIKQTTVKERAKRHSLAKQASISVLTQVELKTYLISIIRMPRSLLILCITNLFCWMSLVCYSLYFTDFVGQAVYGGDPKAPIGSEKHILYDDGVRMGAFGMSLYSLSCAIYSLCIEPLVEKFSKVTLKENI
ncbi:hypothetical protein KUTeg_015016 [Tegillarca granosa]|uniref:Uncharacterized protein n=1 Tax=Tegillarca granosa TaxID=220873 RepID=A0ABQ9ESK1_TEGGR|nr:hypothetical protein KUTeg_015016 [Tegillarca granosa]